ncbi:MAG: CHAT domain-containing protein, partial [Acidimicrobiia bacterium]
GALRRPPVRPPDDGELAADLEELRRLRGELRDVALAGGRAAPLHQRLAAVEKAVRDRALKTRDERGSVTGQLDVAALRRALGPRVLVEFVAFEGRLWAVTVGRRRVRLVDLGRGDHVEQEVEYLLFGMRRLLSRRSRPAAEDLVGLTAGRLDDLLLAPLDLPDGAPVVVVPTGSLHGLPWGALPGLAGRATTVAPSAALWLEGARDDARRPATGGVALVAGPHLPGADAEVREVARLYRSADVLTGGAATVAAVCAALERADLAHVAAHGTFRADSPMFSSLLLVDGPLTVYDLERLRRPPALVVLPACHAAVAAVRTGDELLGTAAALIGLGVRSVIAPVMAVSDDATAELMVDLHGCLRSGAGPAEALASAASGSDPVTARAFVCIGCADGAGGAPGPA